MLRSKKQNRKSNRFHPALTIKSDKEIINELYGTTDHVRLLLGSAMQIPLHQKDLGEQRKLLEDKTGYSGSALWDLMYRLSQMPFSQKATKKPRTPGAGLFSSLD